MNSVPLGDLAEYANVTDSAETHLELRVTMLEEIIAASWPRRILVAARLRRAIRKTNANFPLATFARSRFEATGNDWLSFGWRGGPAVGGPVMPVPADGDR